MDTNPTNPQSGPPEGHYITVLEDGETYTGMEMTCVMVVSNEGNERLCDGVTPDGLSESEVIRSYDVGDLVSFFEMVRSDHPEIVSQLGINGCTPIVWDREAVPQAKPRGSRYAVQSPK